MEGGTNMQPDLEYSKSFVGTQVQFEDQQRVISAAKAHPLQVAEPGENNQEFYRMDHVESLGGTAAVQRTQFQNKSLRWKPSPTVWRLALMIGDGIVLIALLARVMNPAPHLGSNVAGTIFGMWNANLVWLFLALASWSLAVNIMQAQQLNCAASLVKGPLYALCSLVLMLIFCIVLLYLFIGNGVVSFFKPMLFFMLITAPILCIWRVLLAEVMHLPRFRRQAVIVGANAAGEGLAREFLSARHPGVNVLGFISESMNGQKQQGELPFYGDRNILHNMVQNRMIDMIIMAIDYKANPELFQEALDGAQRGISVVPVATVYESISGKIPLDHLGDQWSIAFPTEQFVSPLYLCWNRVLDLVFGICGLLLLCILLPILAPLIYLDSPGPIFFSQERAGYRGRTFRILKLSSMGTGAEGGAWVSKGDARVTRVGRLLRATHLDELPQVFNIVRGDMSLIGPRPERPDYVDELAKCNPFYSYRLSVRPGLTGWAQVKYGYGSSEQDELVKLQYDLFYIKHRSFLLDVLILLKTVGEVVLFHGI
jgi:exopolysaccharide biosynthesis polyprenyl glycosylphosphotransferase